VQCSMQVDTYMHTQKAGKKGMQSCTTQLVHVSW